MTAVDPAANPFATAQIRPGALPFLFADEAQNALSLCDRFVHELSGRAAIVGGHGTGKSTLLGALRAPLEAHYGRVLWLQLRSTSVKLRPVPSDVRLLVIDGYEQLGWRRAAWLRTATRRGGCALLVTSHNRPWRLPLLWHTAVDPNLIANLLDQLLPDAPQEVREHYFELAVARCAALNGNLRETWFALYDEFENRRARPARDS